MLYGHFGMLVSINNLCGLSISVYLSLKNWNELCESNIGESEITHANTTRNNTMCFLIMVVNA